MANFCINCGTRLRKDDKYCFNCGTKVDGSDIKQNSHSLKSAPDNIEKEKARKELKRVIGGKILFNQNFADELHKNGLFVIDTRKAIRQQIEKEIDSGQIKSGGVELRVNQLIQEYKIKNEEKIELERKQREEIRKVLEENRKKKELERKRREAEYKRQEKVRQRQETERRKQEEEYIRQFGGGYCSPNCRHYYEEYFDVHGGIVGDIDVEGYVEYYCHLGHTLSPGSYCQDYE